MCRKVFTVTHRTKDGTLLSSATMEVDIHSDSYNDIKELGIERMVTPERTENHRKTICALIAKEYSAIHQEGS